jgi:hypothetical protein
VRSTVGTRLRLTIDGPELMCAHCGEWWPIDTESWRVNSLDPKRQVAQWGMCLSCYREDDRLKKALRRANDDDWRVRQNRRTAAYKRRWRSWIKRNHPDLLGAHDRDMAARCRARVRSYKRREDAA